MILRRFMQHVQEQNWFAVGLDVIVVIVGIFLGMQVQQWYDKKASNVERLERTQQVRDAIEKDLNDFLEVSKIFNEHISTGIKEWEIARQHGDMPPPFVFRINGAVKPPMSIWEVLKRAQLGDILHPDALFELGYFYNELASFGDSFERYVIFVESEVLPLLYMDSEIFYTKDKKDLLPKYKANMDRLNDLDVLMAELNLMAVCLINNLDNENLNSSNCRSGLGITPINERNSL